MINNWLIWSNEHEGWWRPNSQGYTKDVREAGEYTFEVACRICIDADFGALGPKSIPNEVMFPLTDKSPTGISYAESQQTEAT